MVISLACETGTPQFAQAFLEHGASDYLGPERAPFGYASLFVPILLFYELTEGRSFEEAVERLYRHAQELAMWRLFQKHQSTLDVQGAFSSSSGRRAILGKKVSGKLSMTN